MRKKTLMAFLIVVTLIFLFYNSGFQIGNFSFGKQMDNVQITNKYDIENSQFTQKVLTNKVSVLNLWASWCKPCIEEMPTIEKLRVDFPSVMFYTLSIDKDKEKLIHTIKKHNLKYDITLENANYRSVIRNFLENRSLNSLISTEIVPVTYILKNGQVVYKEEGTIDYESFSKKLSSL